MAREQRPETKARTIPASDPLNHGLLMYGRRLFLWLRKEASIRRTGCGGGKCCEGLTNDGPAPRLPPRSTRTAKRCPFRLRDGLERPSCHVVRGETSPLLATLPQGTMAPVGREDPDRR